MKLKSLIFPLFYSSLSIIITCITFYGGFIKQLNRMTIISWLLIFPFCILSIFYVKRANYSNDISGKDAIKEGLKFVIYSTIILLIFQTIFFLKDFRDYKINYMKTAGVELAKVQIKKGNLKITEAEIPNLINTETEQVTLFKEYTGLVFKNIFLGAFAAFIGAAFMKSKKFI